MAEDDDTFWNDSVAKGFSWEEGDDTLGIPCLSLTSSQSQDDLVSFEVGPASSDTQWEARVREAMRQLNTAAGQPELSISQMLGGGHEPAKLENEVRTLRRNLEKFHETRYDPVSPAETIRSIILGRAHSLEGYRSLQSKENLLDTALEYGDGDAILAVCLMLRRSLKKQKFLSLVCCRPVAVDHLVTYLTTRHELSAVTDLLVALGRFHEAGLVAYRQAVAPPTPEYRIRNLKQVLQSHLTDHVDADLVVEQIHFLERLSAVVGGECGHPERQAAALLHNTSVLKTLAYCCQYYWDAPENLLHSPAAIRKMHKLSEKQFTWVCVRGRALAQAWPDCEALLVGKTWLGSIKPKGGVNMHEMVTALHDGKAPPETLATVLQAMESPSERLELARKLGIASVVADVLLAQRDRAALTRYRDSLVADSRDWFYADNALRTANVKWKN